MDEFRYMHRLWQPVIWFHHTCWLIHCIYVRYEKNSTLWWMDISALIYDRQMEYDKSVFWSELRIWKLVNGAKGERTGAVAVIRWLSKSRSYLTQLMYSPKQISSSFGYPFAPSIMREHDAKAWLKRIILCVMTQNNLKKLKRLMRNFCNVWDFAEQYRA